MINVIIDSRESQLYSQIKERDLDKYANNITISSQQLDLGDIHICFNEKKYILERKTISDLLSSIKDGRYKEQKIRLLSSECDITYIIEGDDIISSKQLRNQTILSSVYIHSMYRDNIRLIFTKNIEDTCTYILTLCAKIIENPEYFITKDNKEINNNEYVDCIKMKSKKIENITPSVCYISQLCQIPNISIVIAKNIQKHYPNMFELLKALDNIKDKKDKIELLCKIDKIGKEKANKIIEYLIF